ncbi:MAG: TrbI/VirB10 family protein [Bryobacteraceae bacterium]
MTPDNHDRDERSEREMSEQDDPTLTARVNRPGSEEESTPLETAPAEPAAASTGIVQQIWRRIKEERNRPKRVEINARGQNNMDRSKAFLVLATAVVLCGFAFLALFSTSSAEKRAQDRRTKPSLGRPESATQQAGASGSTIPLLSADQGAGDQNSEQLSPDDILATSRRAQMGNQQQPEPAPNEYALNQVPPLNDPALEAYRRQNNYAYTPPPPPPPTTTAVTPVSQPVNESDGLKKPSLVFVRNATSATVVNASQSTAQPAYIERRGISTLLPTGSRLVARLQTAVSSVVKTPVIAVIEYNYERDGQIVVPAGTKAIGQLAQANQNGQVGLRFTALEMPDGNSESIEGSGVSLDYSPLKGVVNGRNGAKRALVRSMTGIGTMAAYLVGGRGYGGLTGPIDQSVLLRERIASNIGLAGEQELMALAYAQNVVVTLPGNTRFYIVLQEAATSSNRYDLAPTAAPGARANFASADGQALPTAAELRELVALKNELNRMYREVAATRTLEPPAPQQ